jgi:hypothetical protein
MLHPRSTDSILFLFFVPKKPNHIHKLQKKWQGISGIYLSPIVCSVQINSSILSSRQMVDDVPENDDAVFSGRCGL